MDNKLLIEFIENFTKNEIKTKLERYRLLNMQAKQNACVFVGSSLAEQFPIAELSYAHHDFPAVYNRGLSGATTCDLLKNGVLDVCAFGLNPSKVFINIGTNDIGNPGYNQNELMKNYALILEEIKIRLPDSKVYILSYYPVNPDAAFGIPKPQKEMMFATRTNKAIADANSELMHMAYGFGYEYIDVSSPLKDDDGALIAEYTIEGIHLWPTAYEKVFDVLKPYILN